MGVYSVMTLDGKALERISGWKEEESQDYEKLKEELLRRFRLTEGHTERNSNRTVERWTKRQHNSLRDSKGT